MQASSRKDLAEEQKVEKVQKIDLNDLPESPQSKEKLKHNARASDSCSDGENLEGSKYVSILKLRQSNLSVPEHNGQNR